MGSSISHVPRVRPFSYAVVWLRQPLNTEMLLLTHYKERSTPKRKAHLPRLRSHPVLERLVAAIVTLPATLPALAPTLPTPPSAPRATCCLYGARCSHCVSVAAAAATTQQTATTAATPSYTWIDVLVGEFGLACHVLARMIMLDPSIVVEAARLCTSAAAAAETAGLLDASPQSEQPRASWPSSAPPLPPLVVARQRSAPYTHVVYLCTLLRIVASTLLLEVESKTTTQRISAKLERLGSAHMALYAECRARHAANAPYDDVALASSAPRIASASASASASRRHGVATDCLFPRAAPHYEVEDFRHATLSIEQRTHEMPLDTIRRHYESALHFARVFSCRDSATGASRLTAEGLRVIALFKLYGRAVFATLADTEAWLRGGIVVAVAGADAAAPAPPVLGAWPVIASARNALALERNGIATIITRLRDVPLDFYARFPPRFWERADHVTLTAALLRIGLAEELHEAEPVGEQELRFALRLFRNSHLDLVAFLSTQPCTALEEPAVGAANTMGAGAPAPLLTMRDALDPLRGERALHEGDAPQLAHSYEFVNFFAECGLSALPFNHMKFKLAPRCCGCREYDTMHDKRCTDDAAYYHLSALELELSLTGVYRHALVAPSFWNTLRLVALLRRRDSESVKGALLQFQITHPQLADACGKEAMVRAIEDTPHHRAVLCDTYPAWREFERAARYNMDVVRRVYTQTGSLAEALRRAFEGPGALQAQSVYRHQPHDYITFVCKLFRDFDRYRFDNKLFIDERFALSDVNAFMINYYVSTLDPSKIVDLTQLVYFGMTREGLAVHDCIQRLYLQNAPIETIKAELRRFTTSEYILSAYFFSRVQRHINVRVTEVRSREVQREQIGRMCETFSLAVPRSASIAELARFAPTVGKFVVAPCCQTIKTPLASCMDSHAHGTMYTAYDRVGAQLVCMRKKTPTRKRGAAAAVSSASTLNALVAPLRRANAKDTETGEERFADAQQQERRTLACSETACTIVSGIGCLIEPISYRAKRKKKNRKSKWPSTIPLVHVPPYWITPCCGIWNSYRMECFGPNGYVCGACRAAQRVQARFDLDACVGCGTRATLVGERLQERTLYDDLYAHSLARYRVCKSCDVPLLAEQPIALSQLRRGHTFMNSLVDLDVATLEAAAARELGALAAAPSANLRPNDADDGDDGDDDGDNDDDDDSDGARDAENEAAAAPPKTSCRRPKKRTRRETAAKPTT